VARLTDYEGAPYQRAAQDLSVALYRSAPVAPHLQAVTDEAWARIAAPSTSATAKERVASLGVNWFAATPAFFRTRRRRVDEVAAALREIDGGRPLVKKVVSSLYTQGLPSVDAAARAGLLLWLERFAVAG
jgi:hypothetical protein